MKPILITSYPNPDLDGTASAFGYAELLCAQGRTALATVLGTAHLEAQHVAERFHISLPEEVDPGLFEEIILVDTSTPTEQDPRIAIERVVGIIDHRALHEGHKFPNAKLQIELVGSAATLIVERFQQTHLVPSQEAAHLLYGAIASNTVNFKARVTTERDLQASRWLRTLYSMPDDFIPVMFAAKSHLDGSALAETLAGDFSYREIGGKNIGIGQLEVVGAESLVDTRRDDLLKTLGHLRDAHPMISCFFVSIIDVVDGYTMFLAPDPEAREALRGFLNVSFDDRFIARYPHVIMRKEMRPLWQAWVKNMSQ